MDSQFLTSLEETLRLITVPNSDTIKNASQKLQLEFYEKKDTLPAMIHIMQTHSDAQIRQLAAVESRKLVLQNWFHIDEDESPNIEPSPEVKQQIRESLLNSTLKEQDALVRHSSSRVISAIAEIDLSSGVNQWPGLLELLLQTANPAQQSDSSVREVALYILYTLLESGVPTIGEHIDSLLNIFSQTLIDPTSKQSRVTTSLALGELAADIDSSSPLLERFRALIPNMVEVLKGVISENDSESARQIFDVFNMLLVLDSSLLSKHFGDLVTFILQNIASDTNISEDYRTPALQFLITAVKNRKMKIQALKLGQELTNAAIQIAAEPTEEDNDNDEDDDDEDDEINPPLLALQLIDVLASELPPTQVIVPLLDVLSNVSSATPLQIRAILLCLGVASEGAPDFISSQFKHILPVLIAGLGHESDLVKIGALRSINQLAYEIREALATHHEVLIPPILHIINSTKSVKLCRYGVSALDAVLEYSPQKSVTDLYMDQLMSQFFSMLEKAPTIKLKLAIIGAIGSIAYAAGKAFTNYFDGTMKAYNSYIHNSNSIEGLSEQEIELRAVTFENISAIILAVNKEAIGPYAEPLMDASFNAIKTKNSRLRESAFSLIGAIAKVYGTEISPFLKTLVPEIFACLKESEFDLSALEEDEDDIIGADEDDIMDKLQVNSGLSVEKANLADILGDLATSTKSAFMEYFEESIEILTGLASNFYEGVRKCAISSLWRIAGVLYELSNPPKWQTGVPIKVPVNADVVKVIETIRKHSLDILEEEDEFSVVCAVCDNFAEMLKLCGPIVVTNGTDNTDLEQLCHHIMNLLTKNHPCQLVDNEEEEGVGFEEGDTSEIEVALLDSAMDVLVFLSAALGPDFAKIFGPFAQTLFKYCSSSNDSEKIVAVGSIAEIAKGLGPAVTEWSSQYLKIFIHRLSDTNLEVRSNAAYGVGLVCSNSQNESEIRGDLVNILQKLQKLLVKAGNEEGQLGAIGEEEADEKRETVERAYANAAGCLSRLALRFPEAIPISEVLPVLISKLPIKNGFEENTPIFNLIIELYRKNDQFVINLTSQIVDVLESIFIQEKEIIDNEKSATVGTTWSPNVTKPFEDDEIRNRVVELLKHLESQQNGFVSSREVLRNVIA